jgi:hypothetical protein
MPLFDYECPEGHRREVHVSTADESKSRLKCHCGRYAKKLISVVNFTNATRSVARRAQDSYFSPAAMDADAERYRWLRDNPETASAGKSKSKVRIKKTFAELKQTPRL